MGRGITGTIKYIVTIHIPIHQDSSSPKKNNGRSLDETTRVLWLKQREYFRVNYYRSLEHSTGVVLKNNEGTFGRSPRFPLRAIIVQQTKENS